MGKRRDDKMPDWGFRLMVFMFQIIDIFYSPDKRVKSFGLKQGSTIIDYGCGPGRYTKGFSRAVGDQGKVYAADIHRLALDYVKGKIKKHNFVNVEPVLIDGYSSGIDENTADAICALDMIHQINEPEKLFKELHRISKLDGILIMDDGHQSREKTKEQINESKLWKIIEENKDFLKCSPFK
jgi:ubiquinone/menaquinone biosynthesis C-methylase UbiE